MHFSVYFQIISHGFFPSGPIKDSVIWILGVSVYSSGGLCLVKEKKIKTKSWEG
jgi:hypothetical protein